VLQRCRKVRTSVRASRRMRTATARALMLRDASQRSRAVDASEFVWAAMLLSMRASGVGDILAQRSRAAAPGRRTTCGCGKRSPVRLPCFRPVLYRERRNSDVSSGQRAGVTKPGGKTAMTIRPGAGVRRIAALATQGASCSAHKKSPGGLAPPGSSVQTRHASIKERCRGGRGREFRSCPGPGCCSWRAAWPRRAAA
jgi:hypothetical protein